VVAELIANQGLGCKSGNARVGCLGVDKRDPLLVVHDMERLPFELRGCTAVVFAEDLKAAKVHPFMELFPVLFHDLPHALAGGIVGEVDDATGRAACSIIDIVALVC
jgi:hypothetical protein